MFTDLLPRNAVPYQRERLRMKHDDKACVSTVLLTMLMYMTAATAIALRHRENNNCKRQMFADNNANKTF